MTPEEREKLFCKYCWRFRLALAGFSGSFPLTVFAASLQCKINFAIHMPSNQGRSQECSLRWQKYPCKWPIKHSLKSQHRKTAISMKLSLTPGCPPRNRWLNSWIKQFLKGYWLKYHFWFETRILLLS